MNLSFVRERAYDALDWATRRRGITRRIGGAPIRFPARWSRYYESDYETVSFAFFRRSVRRGYIVFDIGAHMGLFTVFTARLVGSKGRVFAFEPTPSTREVLQTVVRLNHVTRRVSIQDAAVSEASGTAIFHDTGDLVSNANSLVANKRAKNDLAVPTVSIDEFAQTNDVRPNVLKIDAEGAEAAVLRGARHTFQTLRPVALLAIHPALLPSDGSLQAIWELLEEYDMEVSLLRTSDEDPDAPPGAEVDRTWFCAQFDNFDVELRPRSVSDQK
jgi:FkbM family methyltransferase